MNDFWNDRYAGADGYLFGTAPALFLTENPWVLAGAGRALCVADGEGRNSVEVARAGWQVTAFDLSPVAVDRARALAREAGVAVDTRVDDLENDAWADGSFDLVLGIFVQVFGDERKLPLLHRIGRAVKRDGQLRQNPIAQRTDRYMTILAASWCPTCPTVPHVPGGAGASWNFP